MTRVGLVGFGVGGRYFHSPLINSLEGVEFAGVVTSNPDRQSELATAFPGVPAFNTVAELLASGVDLVTVSIPPENRGAVVRQVLEAGVAVVIDKPFALTTAEARELIDLSVRLGVPLTVFQNRRWDSEARTVARAVETGELGDILHVESMIEKWQPEGETNPTGGGLLLDLGSHLVDQVLTIFGPAVSVYGEVDKRPGAEYEHTWRLSILHKSGLRSSVHASCVQPDDRPRFRITGSNGTLMLEGLDIQESQVFAGESPATLGDGWGVEPEQRWGEIIRTTGTSVYKRVRGDWSGFYTETLAALRDGTALPVDPESAFATLVVLEFAAQSAAEGRVIPIPARIPATAQQGA
ncbi:MAG: oxidoreductase, Gfo/Idh/MocA family [Glaciihabitans sp.]|nr:oxidoreductase, Gfo/Idh/MocA family [Glaciihabitans sp.]